jgi:head-tail adaptor
MGKIDFNTGEFCRKITVLKQTRTRSVSGAVVKNFEPCFEAYAKIEDKTISEGGIESVIVIRVIEVVTYCNANISNSARLKIDGDTYEIISVNTIRSRYVKITAKLLI